MTRSRCVGGHRCQPRARRGSRPCGRLQKRVRRVARLHSVRVIDVDASAGTVGLLGSTKTNRAHRVPHRVGAHSGPPSHRDALRRTLRTPGVRRIGTARERAGLSVGCDRRRLAPSRPGRRAGCATAIGNRLGRSFGIRRDRPHRRCRPSPRDAVARSRRRVDRLAMAHTMKPARGVSSLEHIEAILRNDAIYELAGLIVEPPREHGGRHATYPAFMLIAYETLISVFRSAVSRRGRDRASGGLGAHPPARSRAVSAGDALLASRGADAPPPLSLRT